MPVPDLPAPHFLCTVLPTGKVTPQTGHYVLELSILVTPLIRIQGAGKDAPLATFPTVPAPFANWPESTGLPFQQQGKVKFTVELRAGDVLRQVGQYAALPPAFRGGLTLPQAQGAAQHLWQRYFEGAHVEAMGEGVDEGSPAGATPARPDFKPPPESTQEAAQHLQRRRSTVEGISSHDLLGTVVVPLLRSHFLQQDPQGPDNTIEPKDSDLDQLQFALDRLDRLGSAGTSSEHRTSAPPAEGQQAPAGESEEFHSLVSGISDEFALLRWLGLVCTVEVPVPVAWVEGGKVNLHARAGLQVGEWQSLVVPETGVARMATPLVLQRISDLPSFIPMASEGYVAGSDWLCCVDCEDRPNQQGSAQEDSLVGPGFILAEDRLDTMQFDTVAMLRAALRDRAAKRASPGSQPAERRAPSPISHGITVFRKEGRPFLEGVVSSLGAPNDLGRPDEDVYRPEKITRGYVVDVRARPWWEQSQQEPTRGWTAWSRLCARRVRYVLPAETPLPGVDDERCFGVTSTEGATPLSGFLLGALEEDSNRRSLSPADWEALGYPGNLQSEETNYYLLATPGGLIAVADVVLPAPKKVQADGQLAPQTSPLSLGPITQRIYERQAAGHHMLGGGWMDVRGVTAPTGDYFLATEARFDDEFTAVGGHLRRDVLERVLGGKLQFNDRLFCLAIERWRLSLNSSHRPLHEAGASVSLVFFLFNEGTDTAPFLQWINEKVTPSASVVLQARGGSVLSVQSATDLLVDNLRSDLRLVFVRWLADRELEFRPFQSEGETAEALPIRLVLAEGASIRLLAGPSSALAELPGGSVFRVELQRVELQKPDFTVVAMTEVARTRLGKLLSIKRTEGGAHWGEVVLLVAGQEITCTVGDTTVVEVEDLVPKPREASEPEQGSPRVEAPEEQEMRLLRGPWVEHGFRLWRGEECKVELSFDGEGAPLRLTRLKVLARPHGQVEIGWFTTGLNQEEEQRFRQREDVLVFLPMRLPEERWPIIIDEGSVIANAAPFPQAKWRTRQLPPASAGGRGEATLVRLFLQEERGAGLRQARRIEVLNALTGSITQIGVPEGGGDAAEWSAQLLGLKQPVFFRTPPTPPPFGGDDDWGQFRDWLGERLGVESDTIEFLANEQCWLGEIRFQAVGFWKEEGGSPAFYPPGADWHLPLSDPDGVLPGVQAGLKVRWNLRVRFALPNGQPRAVPELSAQSAVALRTLVRVQLEGDSGREFAVKARVLYNPEDFFAGREGQERLIFFLPAAWEALGPLLKQLGATGLPVEMHSLAGVLVSPGGGPTGVPQWWSLHTLPPPSPAPPPDQPPLAGEARRIFAEPSHARWIAGRVACDAYDAQGVHLAEAADPIRLWTMARLTQVQSYAPPAIFDGLWRPVPLADEQIRGAERAQQTGEELLPDQVLLDDGLFRWEGGSLAQTARRRASFSDPSEEEDENASSAVGRRLGMEVQIREGTQIPLRVGWEYQFRLRAVWASADPVPFSLPTPPAALVTFRPFGQGRDDHSTRLPDLPRFLRVEAFAAPRLGYPYKNPTDSSAPRPDGFVKAPDVECDEQAEIRDFLYENGFVHPRVAPEHELDVHPHWGAPADVVLLSDTARSGAELSTGDTRPPGTFPELAPLTNLPPGPRLALRPADLAHVQAERYSLLETWEAENPVHSLYWDIHWAYDEVEECDAWWKVWTEYLFRSTYTVFSHQQEAEYFRPEKKATPGRLLHRLPDAGAQRISIVIQVEREPGVWVPVPGGALPDAELKDWRFLERKLWPYQREWRLEVSRQPRPDGGFFTVLEKGARVLLHPPYDVDWRVDIQTRPLPEALANHALQIFRNEAGWRELWGKAESGRHALLSPAVQVRLRHATNQPARPPRLVFLRMAPRLAGDSKVTFQGKYEIDRASTGALVIQALLGRPFQDEPGTPLPSVSPPVLAQILAVSGSVDPKAIPVPETSGDGLYGRSSNGDVTLWANEYAVSELPLSSPTVSPFGSSVEAVTFSHQVSDPRHITVYYRAVALSRWPELYTPDLRSIPDDSSKALPVTYSNPLRGPFTGLEAIALEQRARQQGEKELWGWHRAHLPATIPPAVPVVQTGRLRTAFQWEPQRVEGGEWTADWTGWSFRRTRLPCCRIWLDRGWYSSGEGELLGVLCLQDFTVPTEQKERVLSVISRWALDGVSIPPTHENLARIDPLTRKSLRGVYPDSAEEVEVPPMPMGGAAAQPPGGNPGGVPQPQPEPGTAVRVGLAAFEPRFHAQEQLWFCDLFLLAKVFRPFLFLALARYQPHAIPGAALSQPIHPHPVLVQPERTLEVAIVAERGRLRLQVTVLGLASPSIQRTIVCRLQRLAVAHLWPIGDVPPDFDPRRPHPLPTQADLSPEGFWEHLIFQGPHAALAAYQQLQRPEHSSAAYQCEIYVEAEHLLTRETRLRISLEEVEHIPAAVTQGAPLVTPYFDQVELPSAALRCLPLEDDSPTVPLSAVPSTQPSSP